MILGIFAAVLQGQTAPPTSLITIPTAGSLLRGEYEVELLMQTGGGVMGQLGVGFSDRFSLGLSYGIQGFIGDGEPEFNRLVPEAQVKYRFLDEGYNTPALALGIDTQGRGKFQRESFEDTAGVVLAEVERYEIKAIGIYLVGSKNWAVLGNFGSHFGISKNVWEADSTDDDINLFLGFDKDLMAGLTMYLEYNAALDDNNYDDNKLLDLGRVTVGRGKGYLNAGFRWHVSPNLSIEIDLNDILVNKGSVEYFSREMKVNFHNFF
ncbi:hypothetical protein ACFLZR_01580 [Candidatus Neomarinimicrobiota bacterium]